MKLNKITAAVSISLAALALTACGSDKKADKPTPAPKPAPDTTQPSVDAKYQAALNLAKAFGLNEKNAKAFAEANKNLDTGSEEFASKLKAAKDAQDAEVAKSQKETDPVSTIVENTNPFIDGYDAKTTPSVSAGHYARQTDSNFDRIANKDKNGSSGYSTTITTNEQNPYLSNYVLGTESFSKDKNGTPNRDAVDVIGQVVFPNGVKQSKAEAEAEPTKFNYEVRRRSGKVETIDSNADFRTLQDENMKYVLVGEDDPAKALAAANDKDKNDKVANSEKSGLIAYNQSQKTPVFGVEENVYMLDTSDKSATKGQLTVRNADGFTAEALVGELKDKGEKAVANDHKTRIFGKNYKALEHGVKRANDDDIAINSYQAHYDEKGNATEIVAIKLQDVQYGRITSNIDVLAKAPEKEDGKAPFMYRQFEEHGAAGTVDTYFHRGTNETSVADMKKVAESAKDKSLHYKGHALTYNLGPNVASASYKEVPTAYGSIRHATIGNFVEATYSPEKSVLVGSIYNLRTSEPKADQTLSGYKKQNLVDFAGKVVGNTVIGESTKLGGTQEKGSLTATFYGEKADELGGSVSSITRADGYADPKWGAVFGAKLVQGEVEQVGGNYDTGAVGNIYNGNSSNASNASGATVVNKP